MEEEAGIPCVCSRAPFAKCDITLTGNKFFNAPRINEVVLVALFRFSDLH
jgi:hypothetical protein